MEFRPIEKLARAPQLCLCFETLEIGDLKTLCIVVCVIFLLLVIFNIALKCIQYNQQNCIQVN